ncbi:hypothetical protein [Altererythrobacter sp. Root672]|uniref:hypothetical protein n=1 Tax=Altererythrobacter sp. Root672 TaxID=1736584 RepID=UPI000702394E|nr:hypothetical protein [Altererythrobacter sp. Root672]KRA82660.1 hypothetical protein ASD76_00755 [Altererythrobacter sp. Root672]
MSEPKNFASLGPSLLARKGGAKPAMRPQMASLGGAQTAQALAQDLEDLGWNDMGQEDELPAPVHKAEIYSLTPAASSGSFSDEELGEEEEFDDEEDYPSLVTPAEEAGIPSFVAPEPEVLRQRRAVETAVTVQPQRREPQRRSAPEAGRRAAFTLRLDGKRHLKLRLASTVMNRSAQQLVTAALDKFLSEIPEVEVLAVQVERDLHQRI